MTNTLDQAEMQTREQPVRRDRRNPTMWEAIAADPTSTVDDEVRATLIRDQRRWTRRYLRPPSRMVSRVSVGLIVALKRVLPFQFRNHDLIDSLCIWFLRRFVAPDAAWLLIRHFSVETNLINFVARNLGQGVEEVNLLPRSIGELDRHAVIEHDINMYNLVIDLAGKGITAPSTLDFSALATFPIDVEQQRKRILELDLETALCWMNIAFCFFLTEDEYERAINSLALDESLMAVLADLTGDPVFRAWQPRRPLVMADIARDVPAEVYWHAVIDEYAHGRLLQIASDGKAGTDRIHTQ